MSVEPVEIRQYPASASLEIVWRDDVVSRFDDVVLRRACRCTTCRQNEVVCSDNIRIVSLIPVGYYAVQIVFDDGHDRGIFPWDYLRQLQQPLSN